MGSKLKLITQFSDKAKVKRFIDKIHFSYAIAMHLLILMFD